MNTHIKYLILTASLLYHTSSIAQNYKYGLTHNLTANDFVRAVSDTTQSITKMPKGMSLAFTRYINASMGISVPIRIGFGKASFDTVGRNFFATDALFIYEPLKSKRLSPVLSVGASVQNLSKQWDLGIPLSAGINIPIDEGFFLNIQTTYRRSLDKKKDSWHYGVGLSFKFNNHKQHNGFPTFAQNNNPNIISTDEQDNGVEVFSADDTEGQAKIIVPTQTNVNVDEQKGKKKGLKDGKIGESNIANTSIDKNSESNLGQGNRNNSATNNNDANANSNLGQENRNNSATNNNDANANSNLGQGNRSNSATNNNDANANSSSGQGNRNNSATNNNDANANSNLGQGNRSNSATNNNDANANGNLGQGNRSNSVTNNNDTNANSSSGQGNRNNSATNNNDANANGNLGQGNRNNSATNNNDANANSNLGQGNRNNSATNNNDVNANGNLGQGNRSNSATNNNDVNANGNLGQGNRNNSVTNRNENSIDTSNWRYIGTLNFPFNKYRYDGLEADILQILAGYTSAKILLVGHTDAAGSETYNDYLSERRAEMCKNILLKEGFKTHQINLQYWGEIRPEASNDIPEGRKRNRRVEIWIR